MNIPYVIIKDIRVDNLSKDDILAKLPLVIKQRKQLHIITLNSLMFYETQRKKELKDLINSAEIVTPDGAGILWAARVLGYKLKERVTGYELFLRFLNWANDNKSSVFLLGARQKVLDKVVFLITRSYKNIRIAGKHHGYFDKKRENEIVEAIRKVRPDFLFVGMGFPQQEIFIYNFREEINVPIMIGIGGSFDVFAGRKPRCPKWIGNIGLEWLFRVFTDIKYLPRIFKLPLFVIEILWYRLFKAKVV